MATSGTNYTAKWDLQNGILTIQPVSGNSGIMRASNSDAISTWGLLWDYVQLTDEERNSITKILFSGNIAFHYRGFMQTQYERQKIYIHFFGYSSTYRISLPPDLVEIDVTGLDTTGATSLAYLFDIPSLTTVKGLSALNTATCTSFANMFAHTKLTNVDISTFSENMLNNEETDITWMFLEMLYCSEIILPSGFQRKHANSEYVVSDSLGISTNPLSEAIPATKDEVTISSDEDFFKLTATSQGGTWIRDISGSAELRFNVNKVVRDGNSAEMQYTYYASSATVEVYLKETSQSSFPSTPSDTFSIEGTGTDSMTLTLSSDNAYDVMVKVYDGETTLYTYPSIDSNVLLFSVDDKGRVGCGDNQGTLTALLDLIHPVGSYYWTSDGNFVPADVFGGTWEKIDAGVTLVSAGTGYTVRSGTAKDGGSANAIVPYHRHSVDAQATGNMSANSSHSHTVGYTNYKRASTTAATTAVSYAETTANKNTSSESVQHTHNVPSHNTNYVGTSGNTTGANMPPYKCAYCWHRTA